MKAVRPPPDGRKKDWGFVNCLLLTKALQVDELEIFPGGFSSIHYHREKVNLFIVASGLLAVSWFKSEDQTDQPFRVDWLKAGMQLLVPAWTIHRFACMELCRCTEVYWPAKGVSQIDPDDIERLKQNGLTEPRCLPEAAALSAMELF